MPLLHRIKPTVFHRLCLALALLWLAVITPRFVSPWPGSRMDFDAYYMGALIAQSGAWEAIYPAPKPAEERAGKNAGVPEASDSHPRYLELARQAGIQSDDPSVYIYPPPVALMLRPLAWFDIDTAYWIWMALLILSAWGIAVIAGEMFAYASPGLRRWRGLVVLLIALSPLCARSLRQGNITCLLAVCVGIAVFAMLNRQEFRAALSLSVATLAKYAGGIIFPIAFAIRAWRMIAWIGVFVAVTALTIFITGWRPYEKYFVDILPTIETGVEVMQANQSLPALITRLVGGPEDYVNAPMIGRAIKVGGLAILLGVLMLIWRRRELISVSPRHLFAACAALLAWWPLVSPLFWNHYFMYLALFFGWMIAEGLRSPTRAIIVLISIAPMWESMVARDALKLQLPEPLGSQMLFGAFVMLAFAVWFLWKGEAALVAARATPHAASG